MVIDDGSTSAAPAEAGGPPRSFAPLPGRIGNTSAAYERQLRELLDLLGLDVPPSEVDGRRWQHVTRRLIRQHIRPPAPEEWFAPLIRAAVYEPDPSFNRQLVDPAVAAFGRRRVQRALLDHLRDGSNPERAGAARAWYWTQVPLEYPAGSDTPTPESVAEYGAYADLRHEFHDTAVQVFVANEDLDLRRCILPGLCLKPEDYPEELRPVVEEAIRIARTSTDEYLRHRVEHQV